MLPLRGPTVYERAGVESREALPRLASPAQQRAFGRPEWWTLDRNESSIGFYRRVGATAMDAWMVYRPAGAALEDLASNVW